MKETKNGQGETEEGQNNTTEPKIGFKIDKSSSNKVSKKLFKITLPIDMLAYSEADYNTCPVAFCRKKIPKNRSIEDHMRQHLDLIFQEVITQVESVPTTKGKEAEVQGKKQLFDVQYHCPDKECKYSDVKDFGHFVKVKYLKQHYVKVHAEKNLKCTKCQKTFSVATYLDIHQAMCGIKFICSCEKLYNSLEALQTHARRKNHEFDITKYKELLHAEKNRIQETKASQLAQLNNNNTTSSSSSKLSNKTQNPIEKSPTELPTVIDFTNHPEIQFGMIIGELPVQCRTKIDFGTQTVIQQLQALQQQQLCTGWTTTLPPTTSTVSTQVEESINTHHNNNNSNIINHIGSKRSSLLLLPSLSSSTTTTTTTSSSLSLSSSKHKEGLEFSAPRPPKRKKSAQTQTARVRVRVSTETQTINVVKRRRSTRYKQSAEAETQCHNHEVGHHTNSQTNLIKTILLNDISSSNNNNDYNNSHNTSSSTTTTTCSSTSTATTTNSNSNNNMITTCNRITDKKVDVPLKFLETDSSSSPCPTKEYSSIANPISEFDSDSFFKEMEEVHIQTQTEPDLLYLGGSNSVGTILHGGDNLFSGYDDVNITLNDADINNFQFNFVTTETQTANPIQSTCCQNNSHHHHNHHEHGSSSSNNNLSTCNFMDSATTTTTTSSTNTGLEDGHSIECEIQTGLISQDEHCNSGNTNCSIDDNLKSVNPNYLETMDNETQTQFYDFLSKMFS